MKKVVLLLLAAAAAVGAVAIARGLAPQASNASSHREAPLISDDPSADNTDLYAFRSPDKPDTVTRIDGNQSAVVATGKTPPDNIGPKSTPNYHTLVQQAITQIQGGGSVFAGQRDDAFFADVGAIFDLINLRKFPPNQGGGKDFLAGYAVHAIALQLPISQLDNGSNHVIGVWASTDRQAVTVRTVTTKKKVRVKGKLVTRTTRRQVVTRPWVQVSRLGNPLVNEAVIPTTRKDEWNASTPDKDSQFAQYYTDPILAAVMNTLFPNVINAPEHNRDDLVAVLLTGVAPLNNTGPTQADLLRRHLTTP